MILSEEKLRVGVVGLGKWVARAFVWRRTRTSNVQVYQGQIQLNLELRALLIVE
jgi:hypothetical protein